MSAECRGVRVLTYVGAGDPDATHNRSTSSSWRKILVVGCGPW